MLASLFPITNDAVTLGLLATALGLVFYTHSLPRFKKFYTFVPALLMCYFIPALLNSLGIVNGESSSLYFVASRYLLPASLILLCLSIDLKGIYNLGPKAIVMFFAQPLASSWAGRWRFGSWDTSTPTCWVGTPLTPFGAD